MPVLEALTPHVRRLVLGACAVVVLLMLPLTPAAAHTSLVSSSPGEGVVLAQAPSQASLQFNEPVTPVPEAFQLYDRNGTKRAVLASGLNSTVRLQLPDDLPKGSYAVSWRVISADSHPISGGLTFAVGQADGEAVAVPTSDEDVINLLFAAGQVAGYLGLMTAVGLTVFTLVVLQSVAGPVGRLRQVTVIATATALVAYAALVPLTATREEGDLRGFGRTASSLASWTSPAGLTWGLAVVGCVLMLIATSLRTHRLRALVALAGAVTAVMSVVPVGHTRTYGPAWLVIGADVLHAAAAAVWFGGLIGLGLYLSYARRSGQDPVQAASIVTRFSSLAAGSVAAVAVTGTTLAVIIVGSFDTLVGTNYGRALMIKLGVAAVIGLLAVWNRSYFVPAVRKPPATVDQWRRLSSAVWDEAVILVAVLGITGVLLLQSPVPPTTTPPQSAAVTVAADLGPGRISGQITPGRTGKNSFEFDLLSPDGKPVTPLAPPDVRASLPAEGLGPLDGKVSGTGTPGRYRADLTLPVKGDWQVKVTVRLSQFDQPIATVPISVTS